MAVIAAFLIAWLFLPMAGFRLAGLPDYTKMSATTLGVLMGAALFDADRLELVDHRLVAVEPGLSLHEAVQRIVLSNGPLPLKRINLTEREQECLLWAAEGKTGWEIANIVSISERTVTFHLQNAAQKLGVVNRQQAISRALSMGLIEPRTIR